jgi:hypothetical protein
MLHEGNIKYFYCVCENFCDSIGYGSGTVIDYGSGPVPLRQKVMVPKGSGSTTYR